MVIAGGDGVKEQKVFEEILKVLMEGTEITSLGMELSPKGDVATMTSLGNFSDRGTAGPVLMYSGVLVHSRSIQTGNNEVVAIESEHSTVTKDCSEGKISEAEGKTSEAEGKISEAEEKISEGKTSEGENTGVNNKATSTEGLSGTNNRTESVHTGLFTPAPLEVTLSFDSTNKINFFFFFLEVVKTEESDTFSLSATPPNTTIPGTESSTMPFFFFFSLKGVSDASTCIDIEIGLKKSSIHKMV